MVFKCQEDSFLKEFSSRVVSCEPTSEPVVEYGRSRAFSGYAVVLEDTILFPAGGGQPHDVGWLGGERVVQVLRRGADALHFVERPLAVGASVEQRVDWPRRFDHMQQHSGQHLLSAVLEREHGLPTTSWWLGADECHVELAAERVGAAAAHAAQERCNQLIRDALPVVVELIGAEDPTLDEAHTRGLPVDCDATIRVVCIGDYNRNMCCGTHVSNLSQLQCIKVLGVEPGKKGKCNMRFVVGDRVLALCTRMQDRERSLTALLKNEPSKHEELVQKMQKTLKLTSKNLQTVLSDLASLEAARFRALAPRPAHLFLSRREATPEFCRAVCRELEGEGVFVLAAAEEPERPGEGQVVMQGPERHCAALGATITEILKAKGAFKNGKFQGKASNMSAIPKCRKLVEEYFAKINPNMQSLDDAGLGSK